MEWISVKDRYPDINDIEKVLVFTKDLEREIATWYQGEWLTKYGTFKRDRVTHWMPLPDIPKTI